MRVVTAKSLLDQLDGATIVSSYFEDEIGLHIVMQDGRVLVICGEFAIALDRFTQERLN